MNYPFFLLKTILKTKHKINIKTIVAPLLAHRKYDENNQTITEKTDKIIDIVNTFFKLFDNILAVFAGITRNAQISIIQKIFILSQMKIESKTRKQK